MPSDLKATGRMARTRAGSRDVAVVLAFVIIIIIVIVDVSEPVHLGEIHVDPTVEVVQLVLERSREEPAAADPDRPTSPVHGRHHGLERARRRGVVAIDREAALEIRLLSARADHDRVDELEMPTLDLDDAAALGPADLVRRQPDARRVAHRVGHVIKKVAQRPVEPADVDGRDPQDGVTELHDGLDGHSALSVRHAGATGRASAHQRQVRHVDGESTACVERGQRRLDRRILRSKFPRAATASAVQVTMLVDREHVEFLASIGPVAVRQDAELLKDVERPVHGRWDRRRVEAPAALDELGARHVPVRLRQDLDEDAALRCPAQALRPQAIRDPGPGIAGNGFEGGWRSRDGHRAKYRWPGRDRSQMQHVAISRISSYPVKPSQPTGTTMIDSILQIAANPAGIGVLLTGLALGIRHGIDWDHIAAITDITSTTAAADVAESAHERQHEHEHVTGHHHGHGGAIELRAHDSSPGAATLAPPGASTSSARTVTGWGGRIDAIRLGTLYALGHGLVVIVLGIAALSFGAILPDWLDPIMSRVVGITLVLLGAWVLYSVYRYAVGGGTFRLRSRWMLAFDGVRYGWRSLQAKLHGHEHVEPLEMSSYGKRTAFGVGMIHGVGAETGTQVLLIAAVGGAASTGLGIPMLFAFVFGLLISNFAIVLFSTIGFVASQTRERIYVAVGAVAGVFSLVLGLIFVFGLDALVPDMESLLPF